MGVSLVFKVTVFSDGAVLIQ